METLHRSHLYEQVPSAQYEYPRIDESQSLQRLIAHESLTLSEDGSLASGGAARAFNPHPVNRQVSGQTVCYQNTYRKRENPLYQSISHVDVGSSDSTTVPCCTRFSLLPTLLAVFACILAFLSIGIVFTNQGQPVAVNQTYLENLESRLESIHRKYDSLLVQVAAVTSNSLPLHELLTNQSLSVKSEIFEQMNDFQLRIIQQISNISRLPGPPGLPGAGNLTACAFATKIAGGASATTETLTPWIPESSQAASTTVITGVECSTANGERAFLNVSTVEGFTQYRCRCTGSESRNVPSRYCYIHFWSCPLIS